LSEIYGESDASGRFSDAKIRENEDFSRIGRKFGGPGIVEVLF